MQLIEPPSAISKITTKKITGAKATSFEDRLSVEEPLEIRLTAELRGERITRPVAITMRTPGEDKDLAAGFLFTEGIISDLTEIEDIESDGCNVTSVTLRSGVSP